MKYPATHFHLPTKKICMKSTTAAGIWIPGDYRCVFIDRVKGKMGITWLNYCYCTEYDLVSRRKVVDYNHPNW